MNGAEYRRSMGVWPMGRYSMTGEGRDRSPTIRPPAPAKTSVHQFKFYDTMIVGSDRWLVRDTLGSPWREATTDEHEFLTGDPIA